MTSSTINTATASHPAMSDISNPAIHSRHSSILMHSLLLVLVIVSLIALAYSVLIFVTKTQDNKKEAEAAIRKASEVTVINPLLIREETDDSLAINNDDTIYFALRTTPPGAEVYKNGVSIGLTPIEKTNEPKSDAPAAFVFVLDGYEVARRSFTLNADDISENIELTKITVAQPANIAPAKSTVKADVGLNNAKVMTATGTKPTSKGGRTGRNTPKGNTKPAPSSEIVLPD